MKKLYLFSIIAFTIISFSTLQAAYEPTFGIERRQVYTSPDGKWTQIPAPSPTTFIAVSASILQDVQDPQEYNIRVVPIRPTTTKGYILLPNSNIVKVDRADQDSVWTINDGTEYRLQIREADAAYVFIRIKPLDLELLSSIKVSR